jgi:hypothetical protein
MTQSDDRGDGLIDEFGDGLIAAMGGTLGACAGYAKCGSSICRCTLDIYIQITNTIGLSHYAWILLR